MGRLFIIRITQRQYNTEFAKQHELFTDAEFNAVGSVWKPAIGRNIFHFVFSGIFSGMFKPYPLLINHFILAMLALGFTNASSAGATLRTPS